MSGGSYNYLYRHTNGLEAQRGDIQEMADRLDQFEAPDAAEATRGVLQLLDQAEALAATLADVWHAAEWRDSGDYGDEEVHQAIAKYRAEQSSRDPDLRSAS